MISDLVALPPATPSVPVTGAAVAGLHSPELADAVLGGRSKLKTAGQKSELFRHLRQSFGRSTLVFQGGSIFGLCHLGVARALFLRGLLPAVITGTGTGALIAALIGIHTDDELPGVLSGETIDLTAFAGKAASDAAAAGGTASDALGRRLEDGAPAGLAPLERGLPARR